MAHKTFISYKYSECCDLRDRIITALGDDATYYQGETSDSPDMTDLKTATIRKKLSDMLYGTSVTIVILSPHMTESRWIDWEIEYSLQKNTRQGRTSQTNGVVGVIQKVDGSYNWLESTGQNCHGDSTISYDDSLLYPIIAKNHFNSDPEQWHCPQCRTFDWLNGSYIAFVAEDAFLADPGQYIDNAYDKSENDGAGYCLRRSR
ncbi:MAG: TIR domain-containing protein [Oscillibacter sp.]|jgi:hypothetical protein|nr:TIR domain-containing protein [Oscillibacter sp.]